MRRRGGQTAGVAHDAASKERRCRRRTAGRHRRLCAGLVGTAAVADVSGRLLAGQPAVDVVGAYPSRRDDAALKARRATDAADRAIAPPCVGRP